MKRMIQQYMGPYSGKIVLELCIKLVSTFGELALPIILSYIVNKIIVKSEIDRVLFWGGIMLLCSVMACVTHIITNRMSADISGRTVQTIRDDAFRKICYMTEQQSEKITIPSLISRVTEDTYILYSTLIYMQRTAVRAPIVLCGSMLFMMLMDPVLAGILIFFTPVVIVITWKTVIRCMPMYQELQHREDAYSGKVREVLQGITTIKAFSQEEDEAEKFRKKNLSAAAQEQKVGMAMASVSPLLNVSYQLCIVLVLFAGGRRIYSGALEPGDMIAFLTYVTLILTALLNVSKVIILFSKAAASSERILEVLDAQEGMEILPLTEKEESEYLIEFDHVSFCYEDKKEGEEKGDIISDVSFRLKRGQWLGIIGGTGSGKSTIIQLMMRFADADRGTVMLKGQDIRRMELAEVRKSFSPAFQYDYICRGSIRENIRFGRNLSDEEIYRAAQKAQALEFILDKPDGFEELIEAGGKNLSGGQKQRLLIARALAGNPEILILDDSFSALDFKTDRQLQKALREEYGKTTTVIVSQRAEAIKNADAILVMEGGRVAGYGTHAQLLRQCSVYQEICQLKVEGEDGE